MAAAHGKLLINVALGFDTFLTMRHGHSTEQGEKSSKERRLGCYFCSDVVAATNSQRDRSLDQQCTVTRPGLSFISSGLAVELTIAMLQSQANANISPEEDNAADISRSIPHQIRGSLMGFTQILPSVSHYYRIFFITMLKKCIFLLRG